MPFTVKDWKDDPDHSTPITAAALEDMETRLAAYTDTQDATKQDAATAATDTEVAAARYHGTDAADVGLLAWAYDAATATAASVPVAATAYWVRLPAREAFAWNRIVMAISTAGTGATPLANCFMGLYDMTGQRRGVSADQASAWATGGAKAATLTADSGQSLTISPADQWAYAAFVVGQQSTTNLQFFRSGSSAAPGQLLQTNATTPPARFLSKAGFAAGLPTSIDYTTCSVTSFLWWMGAGA